MTGIIVEGETFNVLSEGDEANPVLMLAHPIATNLSYWDPQVPAFLEHFRVVRYDCRGHGATRANDGPYSIERLGRDAIAILDALGIEKTHWLGVSMGGMVGLWLLINARERIGRAVLAGTAAQMPGPDMWNNRIRFARQNGMEAVAEASAERWFTKSFREAEPEKVERVLAMVRQSPLHGYLAACGALRDMDLREAMRGITNKVLLIAGRHDPSTPTGMSALIASAIEGAELVTLEAAHLSNIEDEANFTKAAIEFLTAPEVAAPVRAPRRRIARKAAARKGAAKKAAARKAGPRKGVRTAAVARKGSRKPAAKKTAGRRVTSKKGAVKKTRAAKIARRVPGRGAAPKEAVTRAAGRRRAAAKRKLAKRRR
jgi:3-oxoadipate enol-lactonase